MAIKTLITAACMLIVGCTDNQPTIVYDDGGKDCKKEEKLTVIFTGKTVIPYYTQHCIEVSDER